MGNTFIANWKMHKTRAEALSFLASFQIVPEMDIRIAAPYTNLFDMSEMARGMNIMIGAQNMSEHSEGAFTGEISCLMIRDIGAEFVILGHSERRHIFKETDEVIAAKVERAVVEKMPMVLCVGEKADERDAGQMEKVIERQLSMALDSIMGDQLTDTIIAYEPVWAIGTGTHASLQQIEEAHECVRNFLRERFKEEAARRLPILYGGSVKTENVKEILALEEVGGALIGGASLDVNQFNELIKTIGE